MPATLFDVIRTHLARPRIPSKSLEGPTMVIGSAPGAVRPQGFHDSWTLVSVNASQAAFPKLGINKSPDVTFMSDGMICGPGPVQVSGMDKIRNRRTGMLLVSKSAFETEKITDRLSQIDYKCEEFVCIDRWQKSAITYSVLRKYWSSGLGENKISSGVFAILLALYFGSSPIIIAGISLNNKGHAYDDLGSKRLHVKFDTMALQRVVDLKLPVYSGDVELSRMTGLMQWQFS